MIWAHSEVEIKIKLPLPLNMPILWFRYITVVKIPAVYGW